MERLLQRMEHLSNPELPGNDIICGEGAPCIKDDSITCSLCPRHTQQRVQLMAYYDTGLTPELVATLQDRFCEDTKKIDELREKLDEAREGLRGIIGCAQIVHAGKILHRIELLLNEDEVDRLRKLAQEGEV